MASATFAFSHPSNFSVTHPVSPVTEGLSPRNCSDRGQTLSPRNKHCHPGTNIVTPAQTLSARRRERRMLDYARDVGRLLGESPPATRGVVMRY